MTLRGDPRIVVLLVAAASAPYLGGPFVWDDGPLIAERLALLDASGMASLWTVPVTSDGVGSSYYRPAAMTVLAALGRIGPLAVHLASLALHVANAVLVVRVARGLAWPLLAGLVYGLHPLASEALGWCSSLPDLMAIFCGLLGVLAVGRSNPVALVLLLCAGLSKETGLLIPLFIGAAGLSRKGWFGVWLSGSVVVVALRVMMGVSVQSDWTRNLSLMPEALGWSVGSLVWPLPLNAVRSLWVTPSWSIALAGGLVFTMAVLSRGQRAAVVGIGLVMAAPVLALPVILDGYLVAERYMTVGLVGFGLFFAATVTPGRRVQWLVGALSLCCIWIHWQRAPAWQSNVALFEASTHATPDSSYSWHMYGIALGKEGRFRESATAFKRGMDCAHPHPLDRMLRLRALVLAGEFESAFAAAQAGPQDDLSAEYIAWWARAALRTGHTHRATSLIAMLRSSGGYDGPPWVAEVAAEAANGASR